MICDKKNCTGCFACYNICPKGAITMCEDEFGYIYPKIDSKKCIKCDLCKKTCPAINNIELKKPIKCFAARTINKNILSSSSSGGIATLLSKKIIEQNGVVYGASFVDGCCVKHIRIDNVEELKKIQGSKYVHSYINDTYKLAKNDLRKGLKVLFIGTPCQIAGLRKFLNNEYENLYTIDIICHGVPSQKFLQSEVLRINKNLDIDRVNFRDKKYTEYHFILVKNSKITFDENWKKSPYLYTFMKAVSCRDNCHTCKYATSNRCSDMTLGDFWGLQQDSKFYDSKEKGVSVVLPITNKGIDLINMVSDEIDIEKRTLKEAVEGNTQLREACKSDENTEKFKKEYIKSNNFYKTYKKVFIKNFYKQRIKSNFIVSKVLEIKGGLKNGNK